jgi:outer membrane autotransporter protein
MSAFFRKSTLCALIVLPVLALIPMHAQAAKRIYFAGYMVSTIFPEQEYKDSSRNDSGEIGIDDGKSFAGAIGFKLTPQLRIEGEFGQMMAEPSGISADSAGDATLSGSLDTKLAMLNLYYDFDISWKKLRPFIGAGIGYAWHNGDINGVSGSGINISESSDGLIWQVGGGVRYPVTRDLNLIGAYRYLDGQNIKLGSYDIDYGAHEFRVGLSWDLPFQ